MIVTLWRPGSPGKMEWLGGSRALFIKQTLALSWTLGCRGVLSFPIMGAGGQWPLNKLMETEWEVEREKWGSSGA